MRVQERTLIKLLFLQGARTKRPCVSGPVVSDRHVFGLFESVIPTGPGVTRWPQTLYSSPGEA